MDISAMLAGAKLVVESMVTMLLTAASMMIGAIMIYSGLAKMVAHGRGERQGQSTLMPVIANLAIGALMMQLASTVGAFVETVFGSAAEDPNAAMQYIPAPMQSAPMLTPAINIAVLWIYAIGFIAIIRGLILWNEMSNGGGRGGDNGWKGFWHIFFGAIAVNITGTIRVLMS